MCVSVAQFAAICAHSLYVYYCMCVSERAFIIFINNKMQVAAVKAYLFNHLTVLLWLSLVHLVSKHVWLFSYIVTFQIQTILLSIVPTLWTVQ